MAVRDARYNGGLRLQRPLCHWSGERPPLWGLPTSVMHEALRALPSLSFQQAATVTLHMTTLAGGNALSTFRAQQLQPALEAIHPRISGIAARFVHLVATDAAPTPPELERLAALLTYGEPYAGPTDGPLIVVTPRFGTVSPWASSRFPPASRKTSLAPASTSPRVMSVFAR